MRSFSGEVSPLSPCTHIFCSCSRSILLLPLQIFILKKFRVCVNPLMQGQTAQCHRQRCHIQR
eukprot:m.41169 g.41169  ORF g.41169 m.41169 type:complete len:63 (-) comp14196_c0_seq4:497-685(-)